MSDTDAQTPFQAFLHANAFTTAMLAFFAQEMIAAKVTSEARVIGEIGKLRAYFETQGSPEGVLQTADTLATIIAGAPLMKRD